MKDTHARKFQARMEGRVSQPYKFCGCNYTDYQLRSIPHHIVLDSPTTILCILYIHSYHTNTVSKQAAYTVQIHTYTHKRGFRRIKKKK